MKLSSVCVRFCREIASRAGGKDGDEVVMSFNGRDTDVKAKSEGAKGEDYPLTLGSKSFIPGFERCRPTAGEMLTST